MSFPAQTAGAARSAERQLVLELVRRHGWNATSFQVLEAEFEYWFWGGDGCVAYVDTGSAWVAAGAPLCAPERLGEVADAFEAAASRVGRRACFFGTEQRFARATPALRHLPIGEQPVWDPRRWPATLGSAPSVREQLRRARAKGVRVRRLSPAELGDARLRRAIERLIERWQGGKALPPMGFLVRLDPFELAEQRRLLIAAGAQSAPLGLAALAPVHARRGWFLEHLVRAPGAPNGTAELLVDAAMREAAALASGYFTLGLAPLAGDVPGWLGLARHAAPLYDFRGLQAFKAKFRPQHWAPIHLSHARAQAPLSALRESLRAFARGGLLSFALEALRRAPSPRPAWPGSRSVSAAGAAQLPIGS